MRIVVQTTTREIDGVIQHIVEIWIAGRRFIHECKSAEEARAFALGTIFDLGIVDAE